jgi:probable phosphoglycerate mutase
MRSLVILCRHGNTFERGDKVVMVGAQENLPLTTEGVQQALRVAEALRAAGVVPNRVLSGPLQRTAVYASTIVEALRLATAPAIDARLIELDYGAWGGLSQEEIAARFGAEELADWQERGIRPTSTCFNPSENELQSETLELLQDFQQFDGISLVVTSNGRLREFGRVLDPSASAHHKVKTGHACVIACEDLQWKILAWDSSPGQLGEALRGLRSER